MTIEFIGEKQAQSTNCEVQCESCVVKTDTPQCPSFSARFLSPNDMELLEAMGIAQQHEHNNPDHKIKIFDIDYFQNVILQE